MESAAAQVFPAPVQQDNKLNIKEVFFKYLSYWPYFIFSIAAFFTVGSLYIRYTTPMYIASVRMLIADKSQVAESNDLISRAVFGSRAVNMDNELQTMRSTQLIQRVVRNNQLNIYYYASGRIKETEFFGNEPISFLPIAIGDSSRTYYYKIVRVNNTGGFFEIGKDKYIPFKWGEIIQRDGNTFSLRANTGVNLSGKDYLSIKWLPVNQASGEIIGSLNVLPFSEKTTIISASMSTRTPARAIATLNGFVDEFIALDIEKKKENSLKILEFINKRLKIVGDELDSMQADLLAFKKGSRFLSIESEANYYSSKVLTKENSIDESQFNLLLADYLEAYIRSGNYPSPHKIIPVPLLPDPAVVASVGAFNAIQLQKDKADSLNALKGFTLRDLNIDLKNALSDIYLSISNYRKLVRFKTVDDEHKLDSNLKKQKEMPEKQQQLEELNRKLNLKQQTYNYLIQRKEQQEITSVSARSNYEKMDPASSSYIPYEPKIDQIKITSVLAGFALPVLIIFLLDFLNDKITTKDDIVKRTNIAIAGEISHSDSVDEIIIKDSRSVIAEQFRILRTNLQYLGIPEKEITSAKTILVTSSVSGEGKSFISLNLASVLAVTGKKVALLEFDLRKVQSLKIIGNDISKKGITNYLINQINDPAELIIKIEGYTALHLFNTGSLPPNPSELIISERTKMLMDWLKAHYDYIIMDSAPVGPVSDSFALAEYADVVLYVVRQLYTYKKQLDFINELAQPGGKLKNVALVINDVKATGRYGYYGYTGKYGYGYGYGYGGYSYYGNSKKERKFLSIFKKD